MSLDEIIREVRPYMVAAMRGLEDLSRVLVAVAPSPPAGGLSAPSSCCDPVGWVADGAGMTGSAVCDE